MDGRRLDFPQHRFDTLVMFGNNFGICGGPVATRRFLVRAHGIARRKGRLLASTRTPGSWKKPHAAYVKSNVREGRAAGLIRLRVVYGGRTGDWFRLLFVSPDDLLRLCEATGWDVLRILPGREGIDQVRLRHPEDVERPFSERAELGAWDWRHADSPPMLSR